MKKEMILLSLLFSAFIFVLFTSDIISSIDIQAKVNYESASLFLSGSILIAVGILTRKRLLRK